jgi:hypothetical protein
MTELFLDSMKFRVNILELPPNSPKFSGLKLLPYQIQKTFKEDAFRVFVSALDGTDRALTTENRNSLRLLGEEFGFPGLLTQVSDFISA